MTSPLVGGRRVVLGLWRRLPLPTQDLIMHWVNARFLVGVTGVPFDAAGQVLLYHHTYRAHPWGLPAGWLRPRESLEDCLRREAWEEAGLTIEPVAPGTALIPPGRRHVEVVFLCRFAGGQFRPSWEVDDHGFYPPGALPEGLLPGQRPLIAAMHRLWREGIGREAPPLDLG
jgi:8-oxo-dGTP diphosphatase